MIWWLLVTFRETCLSLSAHVGKMCAWLDELNNQPSGSQHTPSGPGPVLLWQNSMQVLSVDTHCPINNIPSILLLKNQTWAHKCVLLCSWSLLLILQPLTIIPCLTLTITQTLVWSWEPKLKVRFTLFQGYLKTTATHPHSHVPSVKSISDLTSKLKTTVFHQHRWATENWMRMIIQFDQMTR